MAIGHHRTPEEFAELSGKLNERFVFGEARVYDRGYQDAKNELVQRHRELKKPVPFREALEVVKHFQPFKPDSREPIDPASPIKQFPYAIRKFIAEGLGLKGEKEKDVLFWTTVGSIVDREFGADAVIEVKGGKDELSPLLRLDTTLQQPEQATKKIEESDKVIIYGEIPDPHLDKRAFDEKVRMVGEEALQKFKNLQEAIAKNAR